MPPTPAMLLAGPINHGLMKAVALAVVLVGGVATRVLLTETAQSYRGMLG